MPTLDVDAEHVVGVSAFHRLAHAIGQSISGLHGAKRLDGVHEPGIGLLFPAFPDAAL